MPKGGLWAFVSNAGHVVLFGLLALWLALALPRDGGAGWPRLAGRVAATMGVVGLVSAWGAVDEWHQSFTGRTPSVLDWLTDTVAAAWVEHLDATEIVPNAFELRTRLDAALDELLELVRTGANEPRAGRAAETVVHRAEKLGRNDPCFCGSGKKFKKCCGKGN